MAISTTVHCNIHGSKSWPSAFPIIRYKYNCRAHCPLCSTQITYSKTQEYLKHSQKEGGEVYSDQWIHWSRWRSIQWKPPFLPEALRLGNYSPLPPQQPHCLQAVTNNFIVFYNIINQILVSITLLFNASKIHLLKYHCLKYSRYYNMSMKSQSIKVSQNIILSSNTSLSKNTV